MQRLALFFGGSVVAAAAILACTKSDSTTATPIVDPTLLPNQDGAIDVNVPFTATDDASKVAPPAATVSSCDISTDLGECIDYGADPSGQYATDQCQDVNDSTSDSGVASETAACSTANRVGSCAATLDGHAQTTRYYSPKWTSDTATADCTSISGTFTAD